MSLFGWGKKHDDEEEDHGITAYHYSPEDSEEDNEWIGPLAARRDRECEADPSDYGQGAASARFQIDDMRRYYGQYRYQSFQEAVEKTGQYWHEMVAQEKKLVAEGHEDRRAHLEFARGNRSMYD